MDKKKKVILKQKIHKFCYGLKIVFFCEAFHYAFNGEYNFTFWGSIAAYMLLLIALFIWEERDYSVRMYPYEDDDEDLDDEEDDLDDEDEKSV